MKFVRFGETWINPDHVISAHRENLRVVIRCRDGMTYELSCGKERSAQGVLDDFLWKAAGAAGDD